MHYARDTESGEVFAFPRLDCRDVAVIMTGALVACRLPPGLTFTPCPVGRVPYAESVAKPQGVPHA